MSLPLVTDGLDHARKISDPAKSLPLTGGLFRFCEGLIEAAWLVCLIVVPLYLNLLSTTVFEPDKLAVFRGVTAVLAAAGIVLLTRQLFGDDSGAQLWSFFKTPLVVPVLLIATSYIVSAIFSIDPRSSWFGSYHRSQGALTALAYALLFLATLSCLKRETQWRRALFVVVLTSVPVSLYGIAQYLDLDPLPWARIFESGWGIRITATLGNPIFLGSYLLTPILLGLGWFISRLVPTASDQSPQPRLGKPSQTALPVTLATVLLIGTGALALTSSRGPLLGLLAGGGLLLLMFTLRLRFSSSRHRTHQAKCVATGLALSILIGILGLTALFATQARSVLGEFEGVDQPPPRTRLLPRTVTVRVLIWDAVAELMGSSEPLRYSDGEIDGLARLRPWIGFGPETFSIALLRHYPPGLSRFGERRTLPDRAHNLILQSWVTRGWFGVAALLLFFMALIRHGFRWLGLAPTRRHRSRLGLALAAGTILGSGLALISFPWMLGIGASAGLFAGICVYVLWACREPRNPTPPSTTSANFWFLAAILAALAAQFIELQSGIETASSQIHLWFLAAAAVALGEGRLAPAPATKDASTARQGLQERADIIAHTLLVALVMVTLGFDFFGNWGLSMVAKAANNPSAQRLNPPVGAFHCLLMIVLASCLVGGLLTGRPCLSNTPLGRLERWKQAVTVVAGSLLLFYLFLSAQAIPSKGLPAQLSGGSAATGNLWAPFTFYWLVLFGFLLALAWVGRLEPPRSTGAATTFSLVAAATACLGITLMWQTESGRVDGDVLFKQAQAAASVGDYRVSLRIYDHLTKAGLPAEWLYLLAKTDVLLQQARLLPPSQREGLFQEMEADLVKAKGLRRLDVEPLQGLARIETLRAELDGDVERRARHLENAKERLAQAVALAPRTGYLQYELAVANIRLGRSGEAERALLRALELDPGLDEARNALKTLSGEASPEDDRSSRGAKQP